MTETDLEKFGKRIRLIRISAKLTQEDLANRSGLHPTYIGGIERGERNIGFENFIKIAHALGQSPSSILEDFE